LFHFHFQFADFPVVWILAMSVPAAVAVSALVAFFSTTMDDFAVMLIFFNRANQMENVRLGYSKVALGMTLAFTIVVLISLLGLVLGVLIQAKYINLIGFIPFLVGCQKLYEVVSEMCCSKTTADIDSAVDTSVVSNDSGENSPHSGQQMAATIEIQDLESASGVLHEEGKAAPTLRNSSTTSPLHRTIEDVKDALVEIDVELGQPNIDADFRSSNTSHNLESNMDLKKGHHDPISQCQREPTEASAEDEPESSFLSNIFRFSCARCLDPFVLEVMVYGLAVSSDNIAIYTSIFASVSPVGAAIVVLLFYILLVSNIATAMLLMRVRIFMLHASDSCYYGSVCATVPSSG
jgi:cadmium resistance protein CadD (predicted permease)